LPAQRRLHDAESLAAAGLEAVRAEVAEGGELVARHVAAFASAAAALEARCAALERGAAVAAEDASGRFQALAAEATEVGALR
jgi:hypothetical protein